MTPDTFFSNDPYEIDIRIELPDSSPTLQGIIRLTAVDRSGERMKLRYEGGLKQSDNPKAAAAENPIERMRRQMDEIHRRSMFGAPRTEFRGTVQATNELWINARGEVLSRDGDCQLPAWLGNASDLVLERLAEAALAEWTVEDTITIVEIEELESNSPFGPQFGPRFGPPSRLFREPPQKRVETVIAVTCKYEIAKTDGDLVVVRKTLNLEPLERNASSEIARITGTGTWTFNRALKASESLDFERKIVLSVNNVSIQIPTKIAYRRLSDTELARIQEADRQRAEEARAKMEELRRSNSPEFGPTDRETCLTELRSGDPQRLLAALKRLWYKSPIPPDEEVAAALAPALEHPQRDIRHAASVAVLRCATSNIVPALLSALDDEDDNVRGHAMHALGLLRAEQAAPALVERLDNDADWAPASASLKYIGAPAAPEVLPCFEHPSARVRLEACRIFGFIDCDPNTAAKVMSKLVDLLSDSDAEVATAAGQALAAVAKSQDATLNHPTSVPAPPEKVMEILNRGASRSEPAIHDWCTGWLAAIGRQSQGKTLGLPPQLPSATTRLIEFLQDWLREEDPALRSWACRLLGSTAAAARPAIPALVGASADRELDVRSAAVRALASIGRATFGEDPPAVALARKVAAELEGGWSKKRSTVPPGLTAYGGCSIRRRATACGSTPKVGSIRTCIACRSPWLPRPARSESRAAVPFGVTNRSASSGYGATTPRKIRPGDTTRVFVLSCSWPVDCLAGRLGERRQKRNCQVTAWLTSCAP